MPVPFIGFQLYNLNDYDVKLFSSFEDDHLYFANATVVEHDAAQDEGSSKSPNKLNFESKTNKLVITQFPFTGISANAITVVDIQEAAALSSSVTLFDDEYNYLLILYFATSEQANELLSILKRLNIQTTTSSSYQSFIDSEIDALDAELYKESKGAKRLQRKVNPVKKSSHIRNITEYVHFLDGEDPALEESYLKVIKHFDNVFLNSHNGISYDASTYRTEI